MSISSCGCVPEAESGRSTAETAESHRKPLARLGGALAEPDSEDIKRRFAQIASEVAKTNQFSRQNVDALERLHQESPGHEATVAALTQAYLQRQDWNALVQLVQERTNQASSKPRIRELATLLVKASRYREAFELTQSSIDSEGIADDSGIGWIYALSAFQLGKLDEAKLVIDKNLPSFEEHGIHDALVVRGLIHFRNGELKAARALLARLLATNDSFAPAHDAIARVLMATGDVDAAKRHMARASEIRDASTRAEKLALKQSATARALMAAWERKDFIACEHFVQEMMPRAPAPQQAKLYEYLAAIRKAEGRLKEAKKMMDKSRELSAGQQ